MRRQASRSATEQKRATGHAEERLMHRRVDFILIAVSFAAISFTPVLAADAGMFLCRSPVVASGLWGDLMVIQESGAALNVEVLASVAQKDECPFVASENLKPIDFVNGALAITDGKVKGWADPHYYILYVNRPDAR
jgi:hypothetical protein